MNRLVSAYRGKRIFVTGHTGFKGAWLCQWLLELGAEVTGFSLPDPVSEPSLYDQLNLKGHLNHMIGDVRVYETFRTALLQSKPDYVFHLAAQPIVRESYRSPVETWTSNVNGTISLLEILREVNHPCAAVFVTTDKVYRNREWLHGYREEDPLGGHDPYSSSKAAAELAIASWRSSFFTDHPVRIASARAGNVIGGGDWAVDRIVPDVMRSIAAGATVPVRNPRSTRPWQHVLEPLGGYLTLAAELLSSSTASANAGPSIADFCSAFNFGPNLDSNRTVRVLVETILSHWSGEWEDREESNAPHEAGKLNLATDKAFHLLGWQPKCSFEKTVSMTVEWYRELRSGEDAAVLTGRQIKEYVG